MARVHPTAIVDPDAELAADVEIGPWAIVGPGVTAAAGCRLGPHATLERNVRLGAGVRVGQGSILGGDPQDLKYAGEESWLEVGAGSVIREYATISRGTARSGLTRIGERAYVMSYVHVAHDCRIGDGVILANCVQLAGHVTVGDGANLSGLAAVHQFVQIGELAFIGGCSRVTQDVPPYVTAAGNPIALFGLNQVGLQRAGLPAEKLAVLKQLYRLFFNSRLTRTEARERALAELPALPEVRRFLDFMAASERGVPA